ncbi:MAG TPA: DUF5995 family protein [Solirubrobacterales bacterium]|nr:DUF5995 family protein [Solirubrobacterales bacterium]
MTATVRTVADVLERLKAIDSTLPPSDGVKWFNKLYLEVTQQVAASVPGLHQAAPGFLGALDVFFAGRYFAAFDAAGSSAALPAEYPFHAWKPLFEARFATGIAPVQFALAGMNAHINHDLAIVICDTCAARGAEPSEVSPEHEDYESVNGLIAKVEKEMKAWMMTGLLKELDLAFNPVDDIVAVWDVEKARDAAWVGAEVIWSLPKLPPLRADYEAVNDRAVGFAGRALLTPVGLAG